MAWGGGGSHPLKLLPQQRTSTRSSLLPSSCSIPQRLAIPERELAGG